MQSDKEVKNNKGDDKEKDDVRLVFEKVECEVCDSKGVIRPDPNSKSFKRCEACDGSGHKISYKIKEIGWFRKF